MDYKRDILLHYGIPKMQWGVRNGPPYPLSTYKKEQLRKRNKKLKEKQKIQDLKNKNLALKKEISDKKEEYRLLKRELSYEKGKLEEYNSRRNKAKGLKNMTDKEIESTVKRLENEDKIRKSERSSIANGKAFAKALIAFAATTAITAFVKNVAEGRGKQWSEGYLKHKTGKLTK